jgi:8-oxo-dGTP diphosphatase
MPRVQCIVVRGNRVLMVKHRQDGVEWWCLPGGGQEPGETAQEGALRELAEECRLTGTISRQTSYLSYGPEDTTVSFLVEVGDQQPSLGYDPEVAKGHEILVDVQWLQLSEIPERDRAFLWAAGLLGIDTFFKEIEAWGDDPSYPKQNR